MGRDEWDDQEDFERYAEWELEAPAFPPRSQLYALEPVGVGTPEVECLTSYLTRLAGEHHVLTGDLLGNMLTPRFDKPSWVRHGSPNLGTLYSGAGALNGVGSQASEWVEVFEDLTQRTDVQALTLLIWAEALPAKELLRPTRAWCPICYQEWRAQGQVIYEPLLWTLGVVTLCARHRRRLQVWCPTPACQRSIPWLASHARPGYCPSCQEWLGEAKTPRPTKQERLSEEETVWQSWVAQVVGELLAHNAALSMAPPRERVTKTLLACIQQVTNGKKTTFARLLGFNWDQFRAWTRGTAIPVFPEMVQLCYRLGTTPLAFLTAEEMVIDLHRLVRPAEPEWLTRELRPPRKRLHPETLRQDLQAIIAAQEEPPPSLRVVAERLGHSVPALRRHCPDLCEALVMRYTESIQAQKRQRLEARAQEVKEAVLSLQSAGVYPSQERVAALLTRPALFLDPEARAVWRQALEELGFSL